MIGTVFSRNGELLPLEAGVIPVDDVNFAYGYGVYETLKVRAGILYFPELHVERLLHSATIIGLDHGFAASAIQGWLEDLVRANGAKDANLKVLLIGRNAPGADLYLMQLNPLFPKRHDYRDGAKAVLFAGERQYPQAKSLNMLISTMAFREAREHDAYDAILVNRQGHLTEGTRTNLFYTDGEKFYTPPAEEVLAGVTRLTVMQCIREAGWKVEERPLTLDELKAGSLDAVVSPDAAGDRAVCQGLFLTSTSTKIMPITHFVASARGPADLVLPSGTLGIPECVPALMKAYDHWLENYRASQPVLVE